MSDRGMDYRSAGVDDVGEDQSLKAIAERVRRSFELAGSPGEVGSVCLDLGYFANVVNIGNGMGLAVSTDGVGTKIIVAEMLGKYDTVGVDCVAMNVNDVLCVGARPITMLDYIAVEKADPVMLAAIADGLLRGAEEAGVSIAGGELAQVKEMVRGVTPGSGFDIVGTAVGLVGLDRLILGDGLVEGDLVIGLASTGIHSNGLTLARKALFDAAGYAPDQILDEFGRSVGEELLEPTRIYVRPVLALLEAVEGVKALAHITGDGLLNLLRVRSNVGFEFTDLPHPGAVFEVIQEAGRVADAEMFRVFNMGVGFAAVVSADAGEVALEALARAGAPDARVIGHVVTEQAGKILIPERGLIGTRKEGFAGAN
jgi:phosphoribosylformylglycinamidine cyclo-ligase